MVGIIKEDLLNGEEIKWIGQSNLNIKYSSIDYFLIPFSLLWGGFGIFWELATLGMFSFSTTNGSSAPLIFPLFGIPFVLLGLYFIFGRFIYKKWKKKNTYYAITNKRVLIVTNLKSRNLQAKYINSIASVNYNQKKDGTGTIRFGDFNFMTDMYENTGLDFFSFGRATLAFFDVDNVKELYTLINKMRNE